ncbi:MAG: hypothetical protein LBM02_10085 [Lachnospiraceae bacterium]|jgi:hypothetical protein|nr:hypothetical protein [Lachnospiraceae bacterium]
MANTEKILNITWKEFINSPFSFIFFAICLVLGYIIYLERVEKNDENSKLKVELQNCNDIRIKDKEVYINLLQNININKILKKDTIR